MIHMMHNWKVSAKLLMASTLWFFDTHWLREDWLSYYAHTVNDIFGSQSRVGCSFNEESLSESGDGDAVEEMVHCLNHRQKLMLNLGFM
jgi:hypothetical protein